MPGSSQCYPKPEGRIGDQKLSPLTDPRFNPKLVKALATQGWDKNLPIGIADENSPFEDLTKEMRAQHYGFSEGFARLPNDLEQDVHEQPVDRKTYVANGVDGNEVKLYAFRKPGTEGRVLPCVVYSSYSAQSSNEDKKEIPKLIYITSTWWRHDNS